MLNLRKKSLKRLCVLCLALAVAFCSDLTSPIDVAKRSINNILDDIERAFDLYDTNAVVSLLHPDFLHNGYDRDYQELIWQQRIVNYHTIRIEDRQISVNEYRDYAEIEFELTLVSADTTIVTHEPSDEYGDLSYFARYQGKWYLFGNQR
jgi:hypothetical protein